MLQIFQKVWSILFFCLSLRNTLFNNSIVMKKVLVSIAAVVLSIGSALAQSDNNVFTHFGGSIGVGSTGITIDLSTNVTDYVGIRAGIDIMPKIKYSTDIDITNSAALQTQYNNWRTYYMATNPTATPPVLSVPSKVDIEGKLNNTTGHVLFDLYPGKKIDWHLTLGAYFGPTEVINVYTTKDEQLVDVAKYNAWQNDPDLLIGAKLGDYFLKPDANGHIDADVKVKGFRPYVGLGWGRGVPKNHTLGFSVDAGVQFWGKPEIYLQGDKQSTSNFDDTDDGGFVKTMTKITVYPTLTFRLTGKFF